MIARKDQRRKRKSSDYLMMKLQYAACSVSCEFDSTNEIQGEEAIASKF